MIIPATELSPETGRLQRVGRAGQAVYMVLVSHANQKTRIAWPSHSTIAACLGCSTKVVERAISDLEHHGLIRVLERGGGTRRGGAGRPNRYKISPPNPDNYVGVERLDTPTKMTRYPDRNDQIPRRNCPTTPTEMSEEQVNEHETEQGKEQVIKRGDVFHSLSDSGSPPAGTAAPDGPLHRSKAKARWLGLIVQQRMVGRENGTHHPQGSKQHAADLTSIHRLWDHVWPEDIEHADAGMVQRFNALVAITKDAKGKRKPMAWMTQQIKAQILPLAEQGPAVGDEVLAL